MNNECPLSQTPWLQHRGEVGARGMDNRLSFFLKSRLKSAQGECTQVSPSQRGQGPIQSFTRGIPKHHGLLHLCSSSGCASPLERQAAHSGTQTEKGWNSFGESS